MALIKGMYYWTKYKGDWRISQYEGTMFWINGIGEAHLADYFDEIDETPIVREKKQTEQQCNCNLPHVSVALPESGLHQCPNCGWGCSCNDQPCSCCSGNER